MLWGEKVFFGETSLLFFQNLRSDDILLKRFSFKLHVFQMLGVANFWLKRWESWQSKEKYSKEKVFKLEFFPFLFCPLSICTFSNLLVFIICELVLWIFIKLKRKFREKTFNLWQFFGKSPYFCLLFLWIRMHLTIFTFIVFGEYVWNKDKMRKIFLRRKFLKKKYMLFPFFAGC